MNETKAFTPAELHYLTGLNNAVAAAQQELNRAIGFMREQHQALEPDWKLTDLAVGFVRVVTPGDPVGSIPGSPLGIVPDRAAPGKR